MSLMLHDDFLATIERTPLKTAVIEENGEEVTYEELSKIAETYFQQIHKFKKNICKSPFIGIMSSVHIRSIGAVLAILQSGGAYVPLDEYSPPNRLKYIIESADLDFIFVDKPLYEKFRNLFENKRVKTVIVIDRSGTKNLYSVIKSCTQKSTHIKEESRNLSVSDNLAYVLHSSGSTGVPKGVMLTHRNARTFIDWMHKAFNIQSKDKLVSRAPFKFDLSVFDIFNTFKAGATLVCFDWTRKRSPEQRHKDYVRLLEKEKVTVLYTTPSTFISLMNFGGLLEANLQLRQIMYAGEPFPVPQIQRLMNGLPHTKFANIYGPTETNIITYYPIEEISENQMSIPLGHEVDDTEIIVVSEDGKKQCLPNEMGELWCRGGTVTLGYLGMAEKTKELLVSSPFHNWSCKFWRTGDFGYRDKNGILHYCGRKDHMVKVKGYRIELGEIETAFSRITGISECSIVAVPDLESGNELYAFYSTKNDINLSSDDITSELLKNIPKYMLPVKFQKMRVLPKNSAGKIDRIRLKEEYVKIAA